MIVEIMNSYKIGEKGCPGVIKTIRDVKNDKDQRLNVGDGECRMEF